MVKVINEENGTELMGAYDYLKEEGLEAFNKDYLETLEWIKAMPKNLISKQYFTDMFYDLQYMQNEYNSIMGKGKHRVLNECNYEGFRIHMSEGMFYLSYVDYKNKSLITSTEIIRVMGYSYSKEDLITQCDYIFNNFDVLDATDPNYLNDIIKWKVNSLLQEKGLSLPLSLAFEKDNHDIIEIRKSGIYLLYDVNFNLVYIGKAKSLRDRVKSHIKGLTHTKGYYEEFHYAAVMYLDDYEQEADLIEKDLIRNFEPKRNVEFVFK